MYAKRTLRFGCFHDLILVFLLLNYEIFLVEFDEIYWLVYEQFDWMGINSTQIKVYSLI